MTTIQIKKIYTKEGMTAAGQPYKLTKLLAGGKYYTTFKPIPEAIKEGSTVELEYEPTDSPSKYSITRIISVDNANPKPKHESPEAIYHINPNPQIASTDNIEDIVARRLTRAKAILAKEMPGFEEYSDYMSVLAELLHQLGAEEMSREIQLNKEKNISKFR